GNGNDIDQIRNNTSEMMRVWNGSSLITRNGYLYADGNRNYSGLARQDPCGVAAGGAKTFYGVSRLVSDALFLCARFGWHDTYDAGGGHYGFYRTNDLTAPFDIRVSCGEGENRCTGDGNDVRSWHMGAFQLTPPGTVGNETAVYKDGAWLPSESASSRSLNFDPACWTFVNSVCRSLNDGSRGHWIESACWDDALGSGDLDPLYAVVQPLFDLT
ncbi:MAG: hypothetical protein ACPG1A_11780, partial [Halioglobus sp.]